MDKFGINKSNEGEQEDTSKSTIEEKKEKGGIMEGFYLFYDHRYIQGIFTVSSLYMIQVTVIDYMLKVLAKKRYDEMYPNNPKEALEAFATFMGMGSIYRVMNIHKIIFYFSYFFLYLLLLVRLLWHMHQWYFLPHVHVRHGQRYQSIRSSYVPDKFSSIYVDLHRPYLFLP